MVVVVIVDLARKHFHGVKYQTLFDPFLLMVNLDMEVLKPRCVAVFGDQGVYIVKHLFLLICVRNVQECQKNGMLFFEKHSTFAKKFWS